LRRKFAEIGGHFDSAHGEILLAAIIRVPSMTYSSTAAPAQPSLSARACLRLLAPGLRAARIGLVAAAFTGLPLWSGAVDFGPFTLTGFVKNEFVRASRQCPTCQVEPLENKQRLWADGLVSGAPYETRTTQVVLFQPWLAANFDLGRGVKLSGLLSQRRRDGDDDIPGFLYERNVALSHEAFGRVAAGAMTARAWAVADYPYGSNVGQADPWASSGAGYGLLTRAVRYTAPAIDVAGGDLVLEASYDTGNTDFRIHKPRLLEIYAQYVHGDLVVDAIAQDARNGTPQAWGHGPFTGLTPFPSDDGKLKESSQSIVLVMARYAIDARWEVSGGLRHNRWSGADAVITTPATATSAAQWNTMFNVDWGGTRDGVANPGYSASSTDLMFGVRRREGRWTASAGMTYLGKARTANPSERGQSNSAWLGSLGLNHDFGNGFQAYALAGVVNYRRLGLSPMSMPSNSAFSGVDSRVHRTGNWFGLGVVYTF
jgi:hypothetical protein